MAQITQSITVEVARPNFFQAIVAKQGDAKSRFLKVTLVDDGEVIGIDPTSFVTINAERPDGQSRRFEGVANNDHTVTVPLAAWMLLHEGLVYCDISVINEKDERVLTSTSFRLNVEKAACTEGDISADEDYDILLKLIKETEEVTEAAKEEMEALKTAAENGEFDGKDGHTPELDVQQQTDGVQITLEGETYFVRQGLDGYSPYVEVTEVSNGYEVSIYDKTEDHSFTILHGEKGSKGDRGDTGPVGSDGVGILGIAQTVTSTADSGTNVITIGLTDGTSSTFTVKNGSKGSTGAQGIQGEKGDKGDRGPEGYTPQKGVDYFDGANGVNGKSAYEYAEEGGYTGSVQEFGRLLANLPEKKNTTFYIVGDSTTAGTWTGSCPDITEYFEGLMIHYKLNVAGVSSGTTLNINGLGAVTVARNATSAVSTAYPVNSVLNLTYTVTDGTPYWVIADYDSNTKTSSGTSSKTGTKLYLVGGTSQSSSGVTTYSNANCYIGTNNRLYSGGAVVPNLDEITALITEQLGVIENGTY